MIQIPKIKHFEYGDICLVKNGFYKNCQVRVLRRRLFGLFYKVSIVYPYLDKDTTRIFRFQLGFLRKANK
jgi:hypothetical protein